MFEFAEEKDFAVDGVKARDCLAKPQNFVGISECAHRKFGFDVGTKEERAEGGLAAIGPQNLEGDGVEVGAKKGARRIAGRGANHGYESFL